MTIIDKTNRNGGFRQGWSAGSLLLAGLLLVGCQSPGNMATRIPAPSTQLAGQEYYSHQPTASASTDYDYTRPGAIEIQSSDSWSPRARQPIQVAAEPDGRQMSYERPVVDGQADSDVIRIRVGNDRQTELSGESASGDQGLRHLDQPVVLEIPGDTAETTNQETENGQWITRQ